MANAAVADAYVQIIPSAKGIKQGITDAIAPAGAEAGEQVNKGFLGKLKGLGASVARVAMVAGAAASAAITGVTAAAVNSYADYEQLVGGIETLYGDAAETVMANAQDAFRNAGLSANAYMETATQFAGALLQSVGGDAVEAARVADMAITDMSDNANKMGVDIERLQDAYRGFSRGNFTMLDNLSLGYGGTRAEMERLLADAEAISGVHYDIESYADIAEAIHVIQTEMGIAGATAEEAATTISGSWGMLQGAWSNLMTSLAGGGDDLETAIQNVFESLGAWLSNLLPRIVETVRGIFEAIPIVAAEAMETMPGLVLGIIEEAFGPDAAAIVQSLFDVLAGFVADAQTFGEGLAEAFAPLGEFLSGQGEAFSGMMERIDGHLADLQPILDIVKTDLGLFGEALTNLATAVAPLVTEFLAQLGSAIVGLMPIVAAIGGAFLEVATVVVNAITFLVNDAQNGFEGLRAIIASKWEAIKSAVGTAVENVKTTVSNAFNTIKSTASSVWEGIKSAISTPINAAKEAVRNAINSIKGFFNFSVHWPHIPLPHFGISPSGWGVGDLLKGIIPSLSISWYAEGGIIDSPTLRLAGIGERGAELVWPSYEPYLSRYAEAIAGAMDGGSTTYIIDGSAVAADAQLQAALEAVADAVNGRRRMGTRR